MLRKALTLLVLVAIVLYVAKHPHQAAGTVAGLFNWAADTADGLGVAVASLLNGVH